MPTQPVNSVTRWWSDQQRAVGCSHVCLQLCQWAAKESQDLTLLMTENIIYLHVLLFLYSSLLHTLHCHWSSAYLIPVFSPLQHLLHSQSPQLHLLPSLLIPSELPAHPNPPSNRDCSSSSACVPDPYQLLSLSLRPCSYLLHSP